MSKKVKRYNGEDGSDISLEQKYPGAKITRGEYQGKPAPEPAPKTAFEEMAKEAREEKLKKSLEKASLPEYERKAKAFEEKDSRKTIGPKDIEGYKPREYTKAPEGSITKDMLRPSGTRGGGAGMGGAGADVPGLKIGTKKKLDYAKGGKVAGKLATRGYGCVKK